MTPCMRCRYEHRDLCHVVYTVSENGELRFCSCACHNDERGPLD